MKNQELISQLAEEIRQHNFNYFVMNDPQISDDDFDLIYRELKKLDPNNKVFQESGDVPCYGIKVKHPEVMGSLDKVFNKEEMLKWLKRLPSGSDLVASPKIDGLAVRIEYRDGVLRLAATRGRNGIEGQLITDNIRNVASIPLCLQTRVDVELRGEIYMEKSAFNEYALQAESNGWRKFKNPRNAAAGIVTQKDPEKTAIVPLKFFCYEAKVDNEEFATKTNEAEWVEENSDIEYVPLKPVNNIDDFEKITLQFEKRIRPQLNFNIDGIVFSINKKEIRDGMGWSGRCPNGAIAYKFKAERKITEVLAIDFQVGRTGVCTPVARVIPTDIDGSTVSNITLHNAGMVREMRITIGSKVLFEKAGDIIPKVVEVSSGTGIFEFPTACPSCRSELSMDDKKVNLWCGNPSCPAQIEERIHHYTKRLEILDVGPAIIHNMCETGVVKTLSDLYKINFDELVKITGGKRSAKIIIDSIQSKKDIPLAVFLSALSVRGLGRTTGKNLAKEFETLERIRELQYNDLITIDDIGSITASDIKNGLIDFGNEIDKLLEHVNVIPNIQKSGNLSKISFCITGSLKKPKKVVHKMIENAGGEIKTSVGKGLDYLVQADPTKESGKSKKAVKLGIPIISEERLMEMI